MTNIVYPDSKEVTYAYYTNNLLKTVTDWSSRVTSYEYYPDGRLSKITRPNNTVRTQAYALDGKLSRVEERKADGSLIALYQYNYNANGTLESRFSLPQSQPYKLPAQEFTYDDDNRIDTIVAEGQDLGNAVYDDDGNLLSGPTSASEPTNFVYNARNFLTSAAGGSNVTSTAYSYDVLGNRTGVITHNSSLITTNSYVVNPVSSLSQVLVREKNGAKTFYVYGLGLAYEVNESGDATYYHYDLIGSTVALTDDSGEVTDRMEYSPYGTVTHRTGTVDTPFLYVGKYGVQTDANGLLYMRARYYSPSLRRFLNSDPIRFGGGYNFFAYVKGNPLSSIDPLGLSEYGQSQYGNYMTYASRGGGIIPTFQHGGFGVGSSGAAVVGIIKQGEYACDVMRRYNNPWLAGATLVGAANGPAMMGVSNMKAGVRSQNAAAFYVRVMGEGQHILSPESAQLLSEGINPFGSGGDFSISKYARELIANQRMAEEKSRAFADLLAGYVRRDPSQSNYSSSEVGSGSVDASGDASNNSLESQAISVPVGGAAVLGSGGGKPNA